jgi:hypothetical protein
MENFSPLSALLGGAMIGLACAILWIGNGRIAGISGIFGQLLPPAKTVLWRIVFLASMVGATFLAYIALPNIGVGGETNPVQLIGSPIWIAIAGLLIGLGTKIGNGCTSGHGVCGLARFSLRSLISVIVFFIVAIIGVAIIGVS